MALSPASRHFHQISYGLFSIYLCFLLKKVGFWKPNFVTKEILNFYPRLKMPRGLQIVFSLVYDPNNLSNWWFCIGYENVKVLKSCLLLNLMNCPVYCTLYNVFLLSSQFCHSNSMCLSLGLCWRTPFCSFQTKVLWQARQSKVAKMQFPDSLSSQ